MNTKRFILIFTLFLLVGLAACASAEPEATPIPATATEEVAAVEQEPTTAPTAVPTQTPLPEPTATELPTATPEPSSTPEPSPTPDFTGGGSGKIIFVSNRDGEEAFYVMNYDGSEQELWSAIPSPDVSSRFAPRYSPDGSQIALSREEDNGSRNIYVINVDGTEWQQLTSYSGGTLNASFPDWSPDGSQIAYSSNDNEGLYIVNSDASGNMPLLDNPVGFKGYPSWSPDGSQIVFNWAYDTAADAFSDAEIFVINADGTGLTPLTENEFQDIGAVWSPDGSKIAFHSDRDGNFEIYVMNVDGSEQTRLTNSESNEFSPVWSPDGRFLAFTSVTPAEDGETAVREIFVMSVDGSYQQNLTNGQDGFNPYWLP